MDGKHDIMKEFDENHKAFEMWFKNIQPHRGNYNTSMMYDLIYYVDDYIQGAWISWLYLTGIRE